jgi:hypothetical protein
VELQVDLLRYVPVIEVLDPSSHHVSLGDGATQRSGHLVNGFLRRLSPGAQASAEQIDLHREAVLRTEVVDRSLPAGYTFVRSHHRGR